MAYRNRKHIVFSLGSLAAGTVAVLVAASCAQNERGEPLGSVYAGATVRPTGTISPTITPTIIYDPCLNKSCADDGDPCTYECQNGVCGHYPKVCDDRNECTNDKCEKGACVYANNTSECSDGDPCTTADVCRSGTCAGTAIGCNDNNTCTTDTCKEGNCVFDPVGAGTICDDQNGCTNSDECTSTGVCVGSGGPDCDDGNPCTKNACASSTCNNSDYEPEGTPCLNDNKCLVNTTCNAAGECTSNEEKNCDDNNPCTKDSCDPEVGCVSEPDNDAECSDGNVCTQNDTCIDGICTPESEITCQAIDECHEAGECDPSNGQCDDPRKPDGEECENTGVCKSGRCEGGTPDPTGEGGAPATGEGGQASAEGGSAGAVDAPPGTAGASDDAGGDTSSPSRGGSTATGGRGSTVPGSGGDDDGPTPPKGEEFKRDPGGCSVGGTDGASGPGIAGFLALAGLALAGLRRRAARR